MSQNAENTENKGILAIHEVACNSWIGLLFIDFGDKSGTSPVGDTDGLVANSSSPLRILSDLNAARNREIFGEFRQLRKMSVDCCLQMKSGAGPLPVHGAFAKLAPDRIQVNVLDRRFDRLRLMEISIEPGAFLPESKAVHAWSFSYGKRIEQSRLVRLKNLLNLF
jgi:hypothetical protein